MPGIFSYKKAKKAEKQKRQRIYTGKKKIDMIIGKCKRQASHNSQMSGHCIFGKTGKKAPIT